MPLPSVLDEIDRLFEELIHRPWGTPARRLSPTGIREVDDGWVVEFPIEGLRPQDLKIEVHGRQLTVAGHRQHEHERQQGPASWTRMRHESTVQRTVTLPGVASPDDIEATVAGNLLSVHIRRPPR